MTVPHKKSKRIQSRQMPLCRPTTQEKPTSLGNASSAVISRVRFFEVIDFFEFFMYVICLGLNF